MVVVVVVVVVVTAAAAAAAAVVVVAAGAVTHSTVTLPQEPRSQKLELLTVRRHKFASAGNSKQFF